VIQKLKKNYSNLLNYPQNFTSTMDQELPLSSPILERAIATVPTEIPSRHYYCLVIPSDQILPFINSDEVEAEIAYWLFEYHGAGLFMRSYETSHSVERLRLPPVHIDDANVWVRLYYDDNDFGYIHSESTRQECTNLHNGTVSDLHLPYGLSESGSIPLDGLVIGGIQKCDLDDMENAFLRSME
jgi:hypothetical protein